MSGGLWLAAVLMIVFRVRYRRWWFDVAREPTRFGWRVGATWLSPRSVDQHIGASGA